MFTFQNYSTTKKFKTAFLITFKHLQQEGYKTQINDPYIITYFKADSSKANSILWFIRQKQELLSTFPLFPAHNHFSNSNNNNNKRMTFFLPNFFSIWNAKSIAKKKKSTTRLAAYICASINQTKNHIKQQYSNLNLKQKNQFFF